MPVSVLCDFDHMTCSVCPFDHMTCPMTYDVCPFLQLQFSKGDLITVTNIVDGGWWEGVCNGNVGWFPGNYVEEIAKGERIDHLSFSSC